MEKYTPPNEREKHGKEDDEEEKEHSEHLRMTCMKYQLKHSNLSLIMEEEEHHGKDSLMSSYHRMQVKSLTQSTNLDQINSISTTAKTVSATNDSTSFLIQDAIVLQTSEIKQSVEEINENGVEIIKK